MKSYTVHLTDEMCWLHRFIPLRYVEISDDRTGDLEKGLYCPECRGPSRPASR